MIGVIVGRFAKKWLLRMKEEQPLHYEGLRIFSALTDAAKIKKGVSLPDAPTGMPSEVNNILRYVLLHVHKICPRGIVSGAELKAIIEKDPVIALVRKRADGPIYEMMRDGICGYVDDQNKEVEHEPKEHAKAEYTRNVVYSLATHEKMYDLLSPYVAKTDMGGESSWLSQALDAIDGEPTSPAEIAVNSAGNLINWEA